MPVDWATFGASVGASLGGGSLITGVLAWCLDRRRLGHQVIMDRWGLLRQSYEVQIKALEDAGDTQEANKKRRESAEQEEAWRAQQGVSALAPRQVRAEGGTSLTQGEVAELRRLLAASATLNPGALSEEDYFLRGNANYETRRYQEALADYSRALELRPDDPFTLNNRGVPLGKLGRHDEALADFNRSLELRPDEPVTLYNRGVALDKLGRHDEALADYSRALELRPDHPDTLNNRGVALRNMGRHGEALADFSRALELRPDDPPS